jgi:hypothetical protein
MLELIPKFPTRVVAINASGQVTSKDYESVLIPIIETRLKKHPKIYIFFHLGSEFSDFSFGAMWDDAKLAVDHFKAWEKIAIVTEKTWVTSASDMFKFAIPCPLKVFSNKQYAKAKLWITA